MTNPLSDLEHVKGRILLLMGVIAEDTKGRVEYRAENNNKIVNKAHCGSHTDLEKWDT